MTRRPPTNRTPPGGLPVGRSIVGELDDTRDDTIDHTPTGTMALRLRAAIEDHAPVPPEWQAVVDAIVVEISQRTAEQRARELAAADSLPRRVRELEVRVGEHEAKHLRLTGANEGNGAIGDLRRRIAEAVAEQDRADSMIIDQVSGIRVDLGTTEERRKERAVLGSIRWVGLKVVAALGALGLLVGHYAGTLKDRYDDSIARHAQDEAWRAAVDRDLARLFATFNLPRSTAP